MKNLSKFIGIIALAVVNTFGIIACDDNPGGGNVTGGDPTVTSVTVNAAGNAAIVNKGSTLQFNASVSGTNSPAQTVTWSIKTSNKKSGTTISTGGLLTVASDETVAMLTVCATSTVDTDKSGDATVAVNDPNLQNLSGNVTISPAGPVATGTLLTASYSGNETVTFQWYRDGSLTNVATSATHTPIEAGSYTVMVSAAGYNSKISAAVTVTGPASPPENWPAANRWTKEIAPESTATLDFSVDADGVCTMIVGGVADSTRWHANAHYLYTPETGKSYTYVFEAWTESGTRWIDVQCYYDPSPVTSLMAGGATINSTRTTYTLRGGTIPKDGVRSLQFHCADQLGTFYVKVISILEASPDAAHWGRYVNPESTATLDYEVDSDGVCKITVGGTANPNDSRWKTQAQYSYTANANTLYAYEFQAWTQSGGRNVWVEYYNDNVAEVYKGSEVSLTGTQQTYRIIGEPANGGDVLVFQCGDQLGTFYIKMLSITEYTPSLEYELIDDVNSPNYYNAYRVRGTGMSGAVVIPDTYNGKPVAEIGSEAFRDCNITSIIIPPSVTCISWFAFYGTDITSISIPASVTDIYGGAFTGCPNLIAITVASSNPNYSSADGILYNKNKTVLHSWPSASGNVTIPNGVTTIGSCAFAHNPNILSITIPASVTVEGQVFEGWTASQTINIQGHANRQSTINAGWGDQSGEWDVNCNAVIHYLGQ